MQMHYCSYGTIRHMFQPQNWRTRRLFARPLAIDQPGMRDSVSVAGTFTSIAQWVAEVRKPPHHGKVQSLRDGLSTSQYEQSLDPNRNPLDDPTGNALFAELNRGEGWTAQSSMI
ncbi:hypothetical protein CSKR_101194 [Clonorchis sinensis]|uniref:Uncharacterized protein n=1 Tax=Clonorchis sinensis TaxID=79923 RepID=A0A419Q8H1_CLOSI|nr:hypothetical protein CSKR_101194 [Clonorchis sinensis]